MVVIHDPKALHAMMVKDQEYFPKGLEPSKCVLWTLCFLPCGMRLSHNVTQRSPHAPRTRNFDYGRRATQASEKAPQPRVLGGAFAQHDTHFLQCGPQGAHYRARSSSLKAPSQMALAYGSRWQTSPCDRLSRRVGHQRLDGAHYA